MSVTWTWECLLDGESGTAIDYDEAVAAAQEHNAEAEHDAPAISYANDAPPPDETESQWLLVDSVRGTQLRQTDFAIEPFTTDLPDVTAQAFRDNEAAWLAFRQGLREIAHIGDPTALVWPTLPPAPRVVITAPPGFVDWSAWGDNWVPA
jgi:hypothetical protein